MSLVVRFTTRSYFLCLTSRSTATSTDFCMRLEITCSRRAGPMTQQGQVAANC